MSKLSGGKVSLADYGNSPRRHLVMLVDTMIPEAFAKTRLEGGVYTGDGSPMDSCNVGVPSGMNISHRRFVIDEAVGAIVGFVRFGPT